MATSTTIIQHTDISGKADKAASPTAGRIATIDADGDVVNSGIVATTVSAHLASTANPHATTAAQVGTDVLTMQPPISDALTTDQKVAAMLAALRAAGVLDGVTTITLTSPQSGTTIGGEDDIVLTWTTDGALAGDVVLEIGTEDEEVQQSAATPPVTLVPDNDLSGSGIYTFTIRINDVVSNTITVTVT